MQTNNDRNHPCQTHGCDRPATHTLIAAKSCNIRGVTDRCEPCAVAAAWRYLDAGLGVVIRPVIATDVVTKDTKQTA
jgi:hypothetical protein